MKTLEEILQELGSQKPFLSKVTTNIVTNITTSKKLIAINIENLSFEQLLKHRVKLIDAWRESKADYGMPQAVKNGFYKILASEAGKGFSSTDIWLTENLETRLDEVEKLLNEFFETGD